MLTCLLALQILILARCRLRAAASLLGILHAYLPEVHKPSHETLRRWLLRIGLHELLRPVALVADWIWVVDHSAPVGPDKALLVIAVPRSLLLQKQGALVHQDVRVLLLDVVASSTGELVEQRLRTLVARVGVPAQIVSDHGSDLTKGIGLLRQDFPQIVDTYDVSHKLACLLKAELAPDERWGAFLAACAKARPRLQQTQGSCLMPPEVRVKARYMNLNRQVEWAEKRLAYLDGPDDPRLARRLGMTAQAARAWVEERLGWLRDFRAEVRLYGGMMRVVRVAQIEVKTQGMRRNSSERFELALSPADLPQQEGRVKGLIESVKGYLKEEGEKLPGEGRYLGSSDLIESLFGKHKQFTQGETHKGIGPSLLLLPLLTLSWTAQGIREALEATPCKAAQDWCRRRFAGANLSPPGPPDGDQMEHGTRQTGGGQV